MFIETLLAMPTTLDKLADVAQLEFMGCVKLNRHEYANCKVNTYKFHLDSNVYYVSILMSYGTEVCGVIYTDTLENEWVYYTGFYSMTTRKHISWFLREYTTKLHSCTQLKKLKTGCIYPVN